LPERGRPASALVERLRRVPGVREVLAAPHDLLAYEADGLTLLRGQPAAVAFPTDTASVAGIVRVCNELGLAFVPRGSGTGLSGGATPVDGCVVIECSRMNRILEIDATHRTATVQPGVINAHLSEAVAQLGLYFAPDPSSQSACTIGGNVAENSGGPHTLKYGTTSPHVLALEVVLPDASVVVLGRRDGHATGYDLRGVFVGSEGTLGVTTQAVVRLLPIPETVCTLLAAFPTLASACEAVSAIIAAGIVPAALEMLDELMIRAINEGTGAGYPKDAAAVLLIELDGPAAEVEAQGERAARICWERGALEVRVAADDAERALLWKGRKEAAGAVGRLAPTYLLQDAVVPRSRLPEIMRELLAIGARHRVQIANVFHAGDGNLHPLILYDDRVPDELERAKAANEELLRACIAMGGTVTGEHGVGMDKAKNLPFQYADADLNFMYRLRRVFDPDGVMNPGKLLPSHPACGEGFRPARPRVPDGAWI
jgi:glycolate oxidase